MSEFRKSGRYGRRSSIDVDEGLWKETWEGPFPPSIRETANKSPSGADSHDEAQQKKLLAEKWIEETKALLADVQAVRETFLATKEKREKK